MLLIVLLWIRPSGATDRELSALAFQALRIQIPTPTPPPSCFPTSTQSQPLLMVVFLVHQPLALHHLLNFCHAVLGAGVKIWHSAVNRLHQCLGCPSDSSTQDQMNLFDSSECENFPLSSGKYVFH